MADDKIIQLEVYHAAIEASLKEAVPELKRVEYYTRPEKSIATPALALELVEWRPPPNGQDSTGMYSWEFEWGVYVMLDFRGSTERPKLELRLLAMRLCEAIEQNRWGLPLSPAHVSVAEKDEFDPDWDSYEVFKISFVQLGRVGVDAHALDVDATPPVEVLGSRAPDIGLPNEEKYKPIEKL